MLAATLPWGNGCRRSRRASDEARGTDVDSSQIATVDELLTTTRSVRRRLDLERPVPDEVVVDCLRLALQAPTGGNAQNWRWLVVRDPATRQGLAELYRRAGGLAIIEAAQRVAGSGRVGDRVTASAAHLAGNLEHVPVLVVPCMLGRHPADYNGPGMWDSILPAIWSFQLALRSRGLGSCYTTVHRRREREAAALLGIPYDDVTQVALLPVAWTTGRGFGPAPRRPLEDVMAFDRWDEHLTERVPWH
ncbi:MAG: nitroreductase [Acidimicrobiia bacterium]|nr:nitroreductase [Acidimicrobiia bacterium]